MQSGCFLKLTQIYPVYRNVMTYICTDFMIPYLRIYFLTSYILCYREKKNQLDAQLILCIVE